MQKQKKGRKYGIARKNANERPPNQIQIMLPLKKMLGLENGKFPFAKYRHQKDHL